MKINRFDDFTKLREVVLGEVNYSPLDLIKDNKDKDFMRYILDETASSMATLEQIFQSFDVKVWRPEVFQHTNNTILGTPYVKLHSVHTSLTTFNNFLAIADTIVEMSQASLEILSLIMYSTNIFGRRNSIKEAGGSLCRDHLTTQTKRMR